MPEALPLFPLGAVLFPGVVLPLHVFEPRYRALVRDLIAAAESGRPEFGVVAIRAGHEVGEGSAGADGTLHDVGCIAVLREVAELEDGRYAITSVGSSRFRLRGIALGAGTPYLTGLVDRLEESDGTGPDVYARAVAKRFAAYRERLGLEQVEDEDGSVSVVGDGTGTGAEDGGDTGSSGSNGSGLASPQQLSYLVAASMVLAENDRQALLECPDTSSRLESELALLTRENALIDAFRSVPGVDLAREIIAPN